MYQLKRTPEDFIVHEINIISQSQEGDYAYFTLTKKEYTTLRALQKISEQLYIPLKHMGFAGSKDKKAITTQMCSAKNVMNAQIQKIHLQNITLSLAGRGDKPISLGDLEGNQFIIVIRNVLTAPSIKTMFVNYFGEQRFSTNNAQIGKFLVQKKFKEACTLIKEPRIDEYLLFCR